MTYLVGILCGDKNLKRAFLCTILLIVTTVFFLSSFVQVFAQGIGGDGVPGVDRPFRPGDPGYVPPVNPTDPGGGVGGGGRGEPTAPTSAEEIAAQNAAAQAAAQARENAMVADNLGNFDDPVLQFLHKYILTGIGSFVAYTGKAFDYAIEEFIIGFGNLYINKNVGVAIDSLWSTVRDIFNLTFIFGLVYIGFKMILDSSDSSARKMLVSLIGAALLVNFSLFITKFVVDFSNIAAAQIYEAFGNTNLPDFSITNGFMTMMGINSFLEVETTTSAGYAYIVGMLIVFAVLIYVFLAGAIMIIIRFVVLCIYMVFSPMMFLGWVFPAMKGHSEKYWKGFLNQAFFAPAFIFMLYLSYRVTYTFNYTTKEWGHFFGQGVAKPVGVDGLIPFFAMVIVFLLASIMVAKNMGAVGASTVVSVGNNIRGRAQNALLAAPRYGARTLIGASASRLGKFNDRLEGSSTGRGFKRALSIASLGALDERARRNLVKAGKNAKFGGSYSYDDDKKLASERATTQASGAFAQSVKAGLSGNTAGSQIAFEQAITGANSSQLIEQLGKYESDSPEYKKIVQAMSHSQVTKLLDSKDEDLSPSKRTALAKARGAQVAERLTSDLPGQPGSAVSMPKAIAKASIDDLVAVGYDTLKTHAMHIPASKMDDLKSKLTPTEHALLTSERNKQLNDSFTASPISVFSGKKDSEIARLPKDILIKPQAVIGLNQRALEIILRENYLEPVDRAQIRTNILAMTGPTSPMSKFLNSPIGLAF